MVLSISLNGSNFVSDKTRGAFEQALGEARSKKQEARSENQRIGGSADQRIGGSADQPTAHNPQPLTPNSQLPTPNSQFATLGYAFSQSYEHQTLTMRVHEQYLNNQGDYARLFGQLMQQQGAIFAQATTTPQQAEMTAAVLETLARSMARFHDLQEQTLDVHKQFLAQQSDYARATIQLLAGQPSGEVGEWASGRTVDQRIGGSASQRVSGAVSERAGETPKRGNGNGHHPQEAGSRKQEARIQNPESRIESREPADRRIGESPPVALSPRHLVPPSPPLPLSLSPLPALVPSLLAIVSDKTGYPADMLELDMDMEADLGIDSIKRVEILGALQDAHPNLPEVPTDILAELRTLRQIVERMQEAGGTRQDAGSSEAAKYQIGEATPSPQPSSLVPSLLAIVSDKTGYPADMLELDMDMEADLGIDSIKRVEILGALQDAHPDLPEVPTDVLAELRTLRQIVEKMEGAGGKRQTSAAQRSAGAADSQSLTPNPQSSKKA